MLLRLIFRWLGRGLLAAAALFLLLYGGDSAVYKLRGSPQGKVTVDRYVAIPLKGQRTEYDYQGAFETPCAKALFPQSGLNTCWQLRRNPTEGMTL
jgi:hypothetical protein